MVECVCVGGSRKANPESQRSSSETNQQFERRPGDQREAHHWSTGVRHTCTNTHSNINILHQFNTNITYLRKRIIIYRQTRILHFHTKFKADKLILSLSVCVVWIRRSCWSTSVWGLNMRSSNPMTKRRAASYMSSRMSSTSIPPFLFISYYSSWSVVVL